MAKVVIIDDEASVLDLISKVSKGLGLDVVGCQTGVAGLAAIRDHNPELAIVDLRIGDLDGLEIINECRKISPETAIIMVTGYGTVETAVEAMRLGAFDYVTKPFEIMDLRRAMEQALGRKPGNAAAAAATVPDDATQLKVIGTSSVIKRILGIIERVAGNDSPVLLEGEFGVGKQFLARALHETSPRNTAPFKAIQCSALPPDLLEAELFGHGNPQSSVFARTRGGTVHLAEVHHLPMRIQAQLNAFLDQALSGASNGYSGTNFNCRLVTSTTQHLENAIKEGRFREDLFYKISVVPIQIPPLRERREDIPHLVDHILRDQAFRTGSSVKKMEPYAQEFLEKYPWPGNISELRNAVERACALSDKSTIQPIDLPPKVTQKVDAVADVSSGEGKQILPVGSTLDDYVRAQEKLFINETLKYNNGSREKTASMLGVSIATLYRKMELNVERRTTT